MRDEGDSPLFADVLKISVGASWQHSIGTHRKIDAHLFFSGWTTTSPNLGDTFYGGTTGFLDGHTVWSNAISLTGQHTYTNPEVSTYYFADE